MKNKGSINGECELRVEDVKEFIKRLKDEFKEYGKVPGKYAHFSQLMKEIDKLAGDKFR